MISGKIAIPDEITKKTGRFSEQEWDSHAKSILICLRYASFPFLICGRPWIFPIVIMKRWDGSGYPRGLKEEKIPITARMFAIY